MTYDNWQMTNDNSINSKCKFTKPKISFKLRQNMLLSHMDKDHPKNESRWSVYIHSGQFWPVWRNQIFPSIQKKVKIEWKSIYVFFCTQTEAVKPTGATDNKKPSLSHFHSSFVSKEGWRQTVTDRRKETASPKGKQNESNQNDYVKKKTKYFPQQFWTKWVEKKGWGGMGRGRRREKKKRARNY